MLKIGAMLVPLAFLFPGAGEAQGPAGPGVFQAATLNRDIAQAEQQVRTIVNQPVTHLPRTAEAAVFSPGWFHAGAIKPDFDNVDIRTSQEFPYDRDPYATSDVTPTEMFVSKQLEFNAMTKYFYVDRSLPKKRLSEPEMLEINRLYRIIGRDEHMLFMRKAMIALVVLGGLMTVLLTYAACRRA